jgi:hypothetical protein
MVHRRVLAIGCSSYGKHESFSVEYDWEDFEDANRDLRRDFEDLHEAFYKVLPPIWSIDERGIEVYSHTSDVDEEDEPHPGKAVLLTVIKKNKKKPTKKRRASKVPEK